MGMPVTWHRRQALMLAGQLPENIDDARLVLKALEELVETFLAYGEENRPDRPDNVLPFVAS